MIAITARPFEFPLDIQRAALLIIDMQRDFLEEGGFGHALGNDVSQLQDIVPATVQLLSAWRRTGALVIHTRESHLPDLSDCPPSKRLRGSPNLTIGDVGAMGRILIQGEAGNQIIPALAPKPNEWVIDKPGKGAFYATDLHHKLKQQGITQLVITGVTTEVCVQTTMREANDRGYDCLLLEDCTASYFPHFKTATIDMVIAQGAIVGWVTTSLDLIEQLNT